MDVCLKQCEGEACKAVCEECKQVKRWCSLLESGLLCLGSVRSLQKSRVGLPRSDWP